MPSHFRFLPPDLHLGRFTFSNVLIPKTFYITPSLIDYLIAFYSLSFFSNVLIPKTFYITPSMIDYLSLFIIPYRFSQTL